MPSSSGHLSGRRSLPLPICEIKPHDDILVISTERRNLRFVVASLYVGRALAYSGNDMRYLSVKDWRE